MVHHNRNIKAWWGTCSLPTLTGVCILFRASYVPRHACWNSTCGKANTKCNHGGYLSSVRSWGWLNIAKYLSLQKWIGYLHSVKFMMQDIYTGYGRACRSEGSGDGILNCEKLAHSTAFFLLYSEVSKSHSCDWLDLLFRLNGARQDWLPSDWRHPPREGLVRIFLLSLTHVQRRPTTDETFRREQSKRKDVHN